MGRDARLRGVMRKIMTDDRLADNLANPDAGLASLGGEVDTISGTVADLETAVGDESSGLVEAVADLETAVGDFDGEVDISTDLAEVRSQMSDIQPADALVLQKDNSVTYEYTATPTAPATIPITAGSTNAEITPGGSTSHNLAFTLPVAKTGDLFHVSYDLGTHAGTLTIGGVVVTGAGVLHFFWNGTAYVTFSAGALTLTVPDNTSGIQVIIVDGGSTNTLTLQLPTGITNSGRTMGLAVALSADDDTACLLDVDGVIPGLGGTDVANGAYLLSGGRDGETCFWAPFAVTPLPANGA